MPHLDFGGISQIDLPSSNAAIDDLAEYYEPFRRPGAATTPALVCENWAGKPELHGILGDTDQYFGRAEDGFVINAGTNSVLIDESWDRMGIIPGTGRDFLSEVLEYAVRQEFADEGFALCHSSGVEYDGSALLFHGWRHAGKTNALLTLLAEGADYLSDDRLWVGSDGEVLGFPLPIHLTPSNTRTVDAVSAESKVERWYDRTGQRSHSRMTDDTSLLEKGFYYLLEKHSSVTGTEFRPVRELFPRAEHVDRSTVDALFMLRTDTTAEGSAVSVEELDGSAAVSEFRSTGFYEWDRTVLEYVRAFDALYPEHEAIDRFERLAERERAVFEAFVDEVETYRLWLPQTEDWRAENTCRSLLERLDCYL